MPTTGNNLIAAVANELNRTDLDTSGSQVAVTQRALNDAMRDLFNRYAFSWRVVDPPMTITLTAGTTLYDTSSGGTLLQDLYVVYLDTGDLQTRPLTEWPLWRFRRKFANLAYLPNGWPEWFTRVDQYKVQVAPPPQSSSWSLKAYYSPEFVDITNFAANITQVTPRAFEVVKVMMLARLKRWEYTTTSDDGTVTLAAAYQLAEKMIQDLIKEDKDNPNISYEMQGANFGGLPLTMSYWASPFVRNL